MYSTAVQLIGLAKAGIGMSALAKPFFDTFSHAYINKIPLLFHENHVEGSVYKCVSSVGKSVGSVGKPVSIFLT